MDNILLLGTSKDTNLAYPMGIAGTLQLPNAWSSPTKDIVTLEELKKVYSELNSDNPGYANVFFSKYCPGNFKDIVLQPYERLSIYEFILNALNQEDENKYKKIHKGTPFYFMGWLAYIIEDFEKALFYMDAAVSEDMRVCRKYSPKEPNNWQETPAGAFLLLDDGRVDANGKEPTAKRTTISLKKQIKNEIDKFNSRSKSSLTITYLTQSFIKTAIDFSLHSEEEINGFRSIVSCLYIFILEHFTRKRELVLRSVDGGSIEPLIIHLFKGCLVFESLLKMEYGTKGCNTLGGYLNKARKEFKIEPTPIYLRDKPEGGYTLPHIIKLLPDWKKEDYQQKIIAVAYALRNTTGHDLSWIDNFTTKIYKELFESILHAIFWHIWILKLRIK